MFGRMDSLEFLPTFILRTPVLGCFMDIARYSYRMALAFALRASHPNW
jgi:hypothetical protein